MFNFSEKSYGLTELARLLRKRPTTVWSWVKRGVHRNGINVKLRPIYVGGHARVSEAEWQRFLAACQPAESDARPAPTRTPAPTRRPAQRRKASERTKR
jgi:hypothetical protein